MAFLTFFKFVDLQFNATKNIDNRLNCYQIYPHSGLLFFPINVEVLSLQPYVIIYHNLLSDLEVEGLKTLAAPMVDYRLLITYFSEFSDLNTLV